MDSSSGLPVRGHPVQQGYPKMIRTSNIKGTKEQEGDKSNTEGSKKKKIPNTKNNFSTMDSSPVAPVHGQDDYPKTIWTSNIKGTKDKKRQINQAGNGRKKIPNIEK
ncbi:hypothetical protein ISN45_Aa02g014340 [Arabidopsis thaliana x Arabidopsis arenosa]|uniref:Uncharacterized protein n=1 Tax=Arabidopsis thaliana x Arabidopsis arenosa TaxID=1240361 RepID=A0A8T2BJQ3_9BRAS|nr:hypothetical protein ISN45_Aa02g014340 [Arabidopsis thaliana x Arabidopsis arenosa]